VNNAQRNIYIISGLAADEKIFRKIRFENANTCFIQWIEPFEDENLHRYANRMRSVIMHENPVLVGLSFGGIVAIEIAKQIPVEKVILISSVKYRHEIPLHLRIIGKLRLHRLFSISRLRKFKRPLHWFFGVTSKEEKELLAYYNKNASDRYMNWSVDKILNWKNKAVPCPVYHIHGTHDRLFRFRKIKADAVINKGGHLIIYNRAAEVQEELNHFIHL
jgi:pimeloyl-ACP methyl ester carboxylesterase